MKNNFKFLTLAAFAAFAVTMTACEDASDDSNNNGNEESTLLPSIISEDMTLEAGSYTLSGSCHVTNGATLTMEPGVTVTAIYDSVFDYILIEQGAKIYAVGTASNPIVMTSQSSADGWGGLHLCGYAPINGSSATALSEIGDSTYGGTNSADNSGTLKYVRVEYSGKTISSEKEANGFSLYGVGSGTSVSYCQAYHGSDDGFEFFGGTVEISNCVVVDCVDDSFDWTQGWTGKATNILAIQTEGCDCLMECDNSGSDNAYVPVSHPTITNATLIGDGDGKGIRLREGTQVTMDNVVVYNTKDGQSLYVESDLTHASLSNDYSTVSYSDAAYNVASTLTNIALSNGMADNGGSFDSNAFATMSADNSTNATFSEGAAAYMLTSSKGTTGAFATGVDWTAGGWCIIDDSSVVALPSELPATISEDSVLTAGEYTLSGACHVTNGATLTIQPGVTIIAKYDSIFDYILIEQGAKIYAVGEVDNPIVMTSESATDGWGGLHLCGYAPINGSSATALSEIGDSTYGGTNSADNSGTLKYVRIEYSGKTISSEKEANGFSLYGVGSGTSISYCQAYHGSDDGFEFFGGTAEISNCVVIDCVDDSFDWTQGWTGKATNIIAIQSEGCDCLMECDNSGSDNAYVPVSHPTITNATLIGDGDGKGVRLREGTQVTMDNVIVYNTKAGQSLYVESDLTHASLSNDYSAVSYSDAAYNVASLLTNIALANGYADNAGSFDAADFVAMSAGNSVAATITVGSAPYILTSSTGATGAISSTDWTEGAWCIMD
ncbi:MAG: hypothetical protein R3Y16_02465 [Rikenellaceae bacterium]